MKKLDLFFSFKAKKSILSQKFYQNKRTRLFLLFLNPDLLRHARPPKDRSIRVYLALIFQDYDKEEALISP